MRTLVRRCYFVVALVILWSSGVSSASAQEHHLLEEYRSAHLTSQAYRLAERNGFSVAYQAPQPLFTAHMDSLRRLVGLPPLELQEVRPPENFRISDIRSFSRLERPVFESEYEGVTWTYLGVEGITGADTVLTRELRARMQDAFGSPTQVVSDVTDGEVTADNNIQFEYWIVVNDSMPVQITDPFGPFDRGLVLAGKREQRELLREVRAELVRVLFEQYRRQPYVDYFFDATGDQWYRAGFDGEGFFETSITRPRLHPGMRPTL